MDSILYDHLIPSVSHILGSDLTTELFYEEPGFFEEKIVIPFISKNSTSEYLNTRKNRVLVAKKFCKNLGIPLTEKSLMEYYFSLYPVKEKKDINSIIRDKANLLDNINEFVTYEIPLAAEILKKELEIDLNPQVSPFRNLLIGHEDIVGLLRSLIQEWLSKYKFDREIILIILQHKANQECRNLLLKIINADYYIGGASQKLGVLRVENHYAKLYSEKITPFIYIFPKDNVIANSFEETIFRTIFEGLRISADVLDSLSFDSLLSLRSDKLTKKFRKKLWELLKNLRSFNFDREEIESCQELDEMTHELREAILSEISKEVKILREYERHKHYINAASLIYFPISYLISQIGQVDHPILKIFEISGKISLFSPILTKVSPILTKVFLEDKCNFVLFAEKVRSYTVMEGL